MKTLNKKQIIKLYINDLKNLVKESPARENRIAMLESQFQQRPLPAEYFNSITDLRIYLLRHPNREMVRQSCLHYLGDQFQQPEITDEIIAIKKISAGVYLTFHTELSLSLDDCEKITEFILKGYDDLISLKAQKAQPITAKSGRKYKNIPDDIDVETWDNMTVAERMRYKGLIQKAQPSDDRLKPNHKCTPIAKAMMGEGRDWWCGKLTEPVKEYSMETHCLHLKTQLKEVVFLCNKADFQQLQLLGRCVTGKLNEQWVESMLKIVKSK